jgi:hypothetical protein
MNHIYIYYEDMFVFCSIVIILYAVFFLEAMDKYKKKVLRKSFQHRLDNVVKKKV